MQNISPELAIKFRISGWKGLILDRFTTFTKAARPISGWDSQVVWAGAKTTATNIFARLLCTARFAWWNLCTVNLPFSSWVTAYFLLAALAFTACVTNIAELRHPSSKISCSYAQNDYKNDKNNHRNYDCVKGQALGFARHFFRIKK